MYLLKYFYLQLNYLQYGYQLKNYIFLYKSNNNNIYQIYLIFINCVFYILLIYYGNVVAF